MNRVTVASLISERVAPSPVVLRVFCEVLVDRRWIRCGRDEIWTTNKSISLDSCNGSLQFDPAGHGLEEQKHRLGIK